MNKPNYRSRAGSLLIAAAVSATLAGCASAPQSPQGSEAVRSKLSMLKAEPQLAAKVPMLIEKAELAVVLAETPQPDAVEAAHRVYLADRLVDTARATADVRLAEDQRAGLKQQSDDARLAARTREADAAQRGAVAARRDADASRIAAESSRVAANTARVEANTARSEADAERSATEAARIASEAAAAATAAVAEEQKRELERQIAMLQARPTERGLVLTLGDVLFASGSQVLKPGAVGNLDRLAAFMARYADRSATIEGHTDSVGEEDYNQGLSQRRAESVKAYLAAKGVSPTRLTSVGKGEEFPVAGNESAGGRQQNRRVDVVIDNGVNAVGQVPR